MNRYNGFKFLIKINIIYSILYLFGINKKKYKFSHWVKMDFQEGFTMVFTVAWEGTKIPYKYILFIITDLINNADSISSLINDYQCTQCDTPINSESSILIYRIIRDLNLSMEETIKNLKNNYYKNLYES